MEKERHREKGIWRGHNRDEAGEEGGSQEEGVETG